MTVSDLGRTLGKCALNTGVFHLPPEKKDAFNASMLTPTFVTPGDHFSWGTRVGFQTGLSDRSVNFPASVSLLVPPGFIQRDSCKSVTADLCFSSSLSFSFTGGANDHS